MANILNSLSKVQVGDVVMSVRDIKKTFIEGGQPLHILRGGGFDLHGCHGIDQLRNLVSH